MPFEQLVDSSDKINLDFKKIVKECFANIYDTLGEKNFIRWLHTQKIASDVKELIVDYMTEEEKENQPNVGGYTRTDKSEIRIRELKSLEGTATHEIMHLFTRHSSQFGTYINEGMTEYITGMISKEGPRAYMDNVRTVEFMHRVLGDSLVKAYLFGKDESFDKRLAELISRNPDEDTENLDDVRDFYKKLNERHKLLFQRTKEDIEKAKANPDKINDKKIENTNAIKDYIKRMVIGRVREQAKNLEFYEDGKIGNIRQIFTLINAIPNGYSFSQQELYDLSRDVLDEVINHSHLLMDLTSEEAETKRENIKKSIVKSSKDEKGNFKIDSINPKGIEEYNENQTDVTAKLFQLSFEDAKDISLMEFVDKTLSIASHTKPTTRELYGLISQYAIEKLGKDVDLRVIDAVVKENLDRYGELFEKESQKQRDVIESKYRKIGDNSYIEQRDNQFYYIEIDNNGQIQEMDIRHPTNIKKRLHIERLDIRDSRYRDINSNEKERKTVFEINGKQLISINANDLSSLEIHGAEDKYKDLGVMDSKEFRKLELASPIITQLSEKIQNGKYHECLKDADNPYEIEGVSYTADVDLRSRKLNIEKFRGDLSKIVALIEDEKQAEVIKGILTDKLIDRTFGTYAKMQENGEISRPEEIQKAFDIVKDCILNGKQEDKEFAEAMDVLNTSRKERVQKNMKHAMVSFSNPEAIDKFQKNSKAKRISQSSKAKFDFEHEIINNRIPINDYFEISSDFGEETKEKLETAAFGLKDISIVGPDLDDRERKILFDKLCEDISSKTAIIKNSKEKEELISRYTTTVLDKIYGISPRDRQENESVQEAYDTISKSVLGKVINGEELDTELMSGCTDTLNNDLKTRVKKANERHANAVLINNPTTKMIYEQLVDFSKKLPKDQFDIVLQGLVNAANKEYERGEKDGEVK